MTEALSPKDSIDAMIALIGKMPVSQQKKLFRQMIDEAGVLLKIHFLQDFVQSLTKECDALGFGEECTMNLAVETKNLEQAYYQWAAAEAERRSKKLNDN